LKIHGGSAFWGKNPVFHLKTRFLCPPKLWMAVRIESGLGGDEKIFYFSLAQAAIGSIITH
jgi:hypothetical protein